MPHEVAPRWQRAFAIATCGVIGAAIAYTACDWAKWPRLAYLPVRRAFSLHPPSGAIAMYYPGTVLWGLGGAACGALLAALACAIWRRPWPLRALQLLGAWSIAAVVLAGAYFTSSLWL